MTKRAAQPAMPTPRLRLTTVPDLIDVVPYVLGFHPHDSLVVVALRGDPPGEFRAALRADLDDMRDDAGHAAAIADCLSRDKADAAIALVFRGRDVDDGELPDRFAVEYLAGSFADRGIVLLDAIHVGATRWWSYTRDRPSGGSTLPAAQGQTSPVAAAATFAGLVVLPDRAALARTLDPVGPEQRATLEPAVARAAAALADLVARDGSPARWRDRATQALWGAVVEQRWQPRRWLDDELTAQLLVSLADDQVRDMCCQWNDGAIGLAALELWRQLARRAVPPYDVAPLTLVAWVAWYTGQGALARIAVERALASDSRCRLALLLQEAFDRGVRPDAVDMWGKSRRSSERSSATTSGESPKPERSPKVERLRQPGRFCRPGRD